MTEQNKLCKLTSTTSQQQQQQQNMHKLFVMNITYTTSGLFGGGVGFAPKSRIHCNNPSTEFIGELFKVTIKN